MNIDALKRLVDHAGTYRGEHYRATYHDDGRLELARIGDKELYEAISAGDVPKVQRMMDSQR